MYSKIKQSLGSVWVSLEDFSGFICEVEHPSEADDQKRVFVQLLLFLRLGFRSTCNALKEKYVVWLLTVDAFDWTTNGCSFMGKMHVRLPELSVVGDVEQMVVTFNQCLARVPSRYKTYDALQFVAKRHPRPQ